MESRFRAVLNSLVGLAVFVAILAAVARLFVLAIENGATFGAALIAALATVGAATVVRQFERQRAMEAVRREHMSTIYTEMAQILHGRDVPERKREKLILDFMRKSLMYASPKTLEAFRKWSTGLPDDENDWPPEELKASSLRYESFVKAMRKDLGISNWGLNDGDLARLGINDYDDLP